MSTDQWETLQRELVTHPIVEEPTRNNDFTSECNYRQLFNTSVRERNTQHVTCG